MENHEIMLSIENYELENSINTESNVNIRKGVMIFNYSSKNIISAFMFQYKEKEKESHDILVPGVFAPQSEGIGKFYLVKMFHGTQCFLTISKEGKLLNLSSIYYLKSVINYILQDIQYFDGTVYMVMLNSSSTVIYTYTEEHKFNNASSYINNEYNGTIVIKERIYSFQKNKKLSQPFTKYNVLFSNVSTISSILDFKIYEHDTDWKPFAQIPLCSISLNIQEENEIKFNNSVLQNENILYSVVSNQLTVNINTQPVMIKINNTDKLEFDIIAQHSYPFLYNHDLKAMNGEALPKDMNYSISLRGLLHIILTNFIIYETEHNFSMIIETSFLSNSFSKTFQIPFYLTIDQC